MSASAGSRRNGRGQLSSIDLLPEQADEAIAWANAQLRERTMPQQEILRQFNAMLADHGIGAISRSAFSRHSVRTEIEVQRQEYTDRVSNAVLNRMQGLQTASTSGGVALDAQRLVLVELLLAEQLDHRKIQKAAALLVSMLREQAA